MFTVLMTVLGVALALLGSLETLLAVLHPRATTGPVTRVVVRAFCGFAGTAIGRQRNVAVLSGPLLIIVQVCLWASLLLLGFSLILWPQVGAGLKSTSGPLPNPDFVAAFYYAGFTLTTLGVGDLVAQTSTLKIVTVLFAGLGFSFFTLVLAYVLSIYSALAQRNRFANEIHYRTGRTGDTLEYLLPYLRTEQFDALNQDLIALASQMAALLENHHLYPTLHYFRFTEPRYDMSRLLRFCLETASVARALRVVAAEERQFNPEPMDRLWHATLQMLDESNLQFLGDRPAEIASDDELAERLSADLGQSLMRDSVSRDSFQTAYVDQQHAWLNDLNSLAVSTGTQG